MPNFVVQEICSFVKPGDKEKIWAGWFGFPAMRMVDGRVPLTTKPGIGFELSEAGFFCRFSRWPGVARTKVVP